MKKSKSSKRWLHEHFNDTFVKQAQQEGYPSRSAYKLLEIQKKDQLLAPNMTVVDLGAAPGGWTMVAKKCVGAKGQVFALDILAMEPINGVEFIQGDFTEEEVFGQLIDALKGAQVDVVLSDMAPNLSGIAGVDQPKAMYLAELALDFATRVLRPKGCMLIKTFQGEGFDAFLGALRQTFGKVVIRKPKASRARSKEVYLLATDFH